MRAFVDLPQLWYVPAFYCPACTDIQSRVDFVAANLGDKPWMEWESFYAGPDSAMSAYSTANVATTQAARGSVYQAMVNGIVNTKTTATGSYPVTGFLWWDLYDGQNLNEGLATPSDNPYDGHCVITGSTTDQWGYPCGGEAANYGDFLTDVTNANNGATSSMPP